MFDIDRYKRDYFQTNVAMALSSLQADWRVLGAPIFPAGRISAAERTENYLPFGGSLFFLSLELSTKRLFN